ncbi:SH3 domain-containing protein, partial [Enterocloster asparagiformis]
APVTVEAPTEPPTQEQVPEPTEPTTQAEETGGVYVITGSAVNVRKEPSKDARILAQLTKGATVDYVKRYSNEWAVINYDGQEAYVASQYLEKQVPATEGENTPATSPAAQ